MGYRHSAEEILDAAVKTALESGMATLTFSRIGERLRISDRTVVYYFPTKLQLIDSVAGALAASMMILLEDAFGSAPLSQRDLMDRAWPILTSSSADRVFALYFEIIGLASSGQVPYTALAPRLLAGWVEWLIPRTLGSTTEIRRRRALATVGQIDGLLLVRQVLGAEAGDAAAQEAGIRTRSPDQTAVKRHRAADREDERAPCGRGITGSAEAGPDGRTG